MRSWSWYYCWTACVMHVADGYVIVALYEREGLYKYTVDGYVDGVLANLSRSVRTAMVCLPNSWDRPSACVPQIKESTRKRIHMATRSRCCAP
jgi:hypothetical protein